MWFWILSLAVSLWVLFDARSRATSGVSWALGTFFLMPLFLPLYFAKRPLKVGEVREGGTAWNALRNFAIFWTVIMALAAVSGLVSAASSLDSVDTDAGRAGAGIGIMLGLGFIGAFWFFPMVGAAVLGVILKKNSVIERGPTGPMANARSLSAESVAAACEATDAQPAASSKMPTAAIVVGGVVVTLAIIGSMGRSLDSNPPENGGSNTGQTSSGSHDDGNITMSQFLQLREGMSYTDVEQILARPGEEMSRSDIAGYTTVMYTWSNPTGFANMNAMFQNGRLITKAQLGLK